MFVVVDLAFVTANMMKVFEGGWFPLVVAAIVFFLMSTWLQGRLALLRKLERDTYPLSDFIAQVHGKTRVPGTAIYLTSRIDMVPVPLLHNLKHNKVLHERIVLLHVVTENIPRVAPARRIEAAISATIFIPSSSITALWNNRTFPARSTHCRAQGLHFNMMDTSFFVGRVTIVADRRSRFSRSGARSSTSCIAMRFQRRNFSASRPTG